MIKSEVRNNTGLIIFNRPEKRNALNPEMNGLIIAQLNEFAKQENIKAVILSGEGTSFCAGADLAWLKKISENSSQRNESDTEEIAQLFLTIYDYPKPVIAAVNGPAVGGGCGIASVCDFLIADRNEAKFGYTEVKIGFIPAIVSVFLIKKIGEGKAKQLLLTGELIDPEKALQIGLADYLSGNVIEDAFLLAEKLNANSPFSVSLTKDLIRNTSNMNVHDAVNYCVRLNAISRSSKDFIKGINKFLNKN
ncbi:MAG: enoyl-CoA hydratase/isomerase family protein [Ignavibacteriaceae bacterium]|nr:enoyl-CoA hydratase/isomerase family protein [Ignavibacteriaceae bacterium]